MTIWRMRLACWIPKATNTHSQYVIFIAFPLQQSFHEHSSMLRHTYIASLLNFYPINSVSLSRFNTSLHISVSLSNFSNLSRSLVPSFPLITFPASPVTSVVRSITSSEVTYAKGKGTQVGRPIHRSI
jgi:hypothetical protein